MILCAITAHVESVEHKVLFGAMESQTVNADIFAVQFAGLVVRKGVGYGALQYGNCWA